MFCHPELSRALAAQHTRELEHAAVAARLARTARQASTHRRRVWPQRGHLRLRAALARLTHRRLRPAVG